MLYSHEAITAWMTVIHCIETNDVDTWINNINTKVIKSSMYLVNRVSHKHFKIFWHVRNALRMLGCFYVKNVQQMCFRFNPHMGGVPHNAAAISISGYFFSVWLLSLVISLITVSIRRHSWILFILVNFEVCNWNYWLHWLGDLKCRALKPDTPLYSVLCSRSPISVLKFAQVSFYGIAPAIPGATSYCSRIWMSDWLAVLQSLTS